VLGFLNKERIIFWDTNSEDKFKSFCEDYIPTEILDEDDDALNSLESLTAG
jgi:hypothetical protein